MRVLLMWKKNVKLPQAAAQNTDTCLILGNGPSLNTSLAQAAGLLKQANLFCVNAFALSDLYTKLQPHYYILAAPEYWLHNVLDIYIKNRRETFEAIIEKTTWPLTILAAAEAQKYPEFAQLLLQNKHIKICYFNTTPIEGFTSACHFFYQKAWGMPRPHNVLIPALMLSLAMGYKQIYLLGADHSWLPEICVNDRNEVLVHQKHFYDDQQSKADRMYYGGRRPRRLYEVLEKFYLTFRAYFDIELYARSQNAIIYNATPNSFIDAFERKKL